MYATERTIAERLAIGGGEAARFETSIRLPEDVPTSTPGKPIRWRVEVTAGEPSVFSMARSIRVRPSTRRPRRSRASSSGR